MAAGGLEGVPFGLLSRTFAGVSDEGTLAELEAEGGSGGIAWLFDDVRVLGAAEGATAGGALTGDGEAELVAEDGTLSVAAEEIVTRLFLHGCGTVNSCFGVCPNSCICISSALRRL